MQNNAPVKITLTGLRNYLLRDKSERDTAGTRIEIVLRENIEQGELRKMVADWCRRVEFPVIVDDFGKKHTITAERPEEFIFEHQLVTNPNAKFLMRTFPINNSGVEGEIYILAYIDENGESWAKTGEMFSDYSKSHPLAYTPKLPENLVCLHGIKLNERRILWFYELNFRLDFRDKKYIPTLSRGEANLSENIKGNLIDEITVEYEKLLTQHLENSALANLQDGWKYKQLLIESFHLHSFWDSIPETIPVYIDSSLKLISLDDLLKFEDIYTVKKFNKRIYNYSEQNFDKNIIADFNVNSPLLINNDLEFISDRFIDYIFRQSYSINGILWLSNDYVGFHWIKNDKRQTDIINLQQFIDFKRNDLFFMGTTKAYNFSQGIILYNIAHPLGRWMIDIGKAINSGESSITSTFY